MFAFDLIPEPDFVSSFAFEDYVFFFFREMAVEYTNCGKVRFYYHLYITNPPLTRFLRVN